MSIYILKEISKILYAGPEDSGNIDSFHLYTARSLIVFSILSAAISLYAVFNQPGNLLIILQLALLGWMVLFTIFTQAAWSSYLGGLSGIGFAGIYMGAALGIVAILLPGRRID